MRSKHVCLVFDSEGTFDIRWVGARHDADVDVLRRSTLASCPDTVSVVLVVHSVSSAVSSWHALRELERRYPGVPTFMTTLAPDGDWLIAAAGPTATGYQLVEFLWSTCASGGPLATDAQSLCVGVHQ